MRPYKSLWHLAQSSLQRLLGPDRPTKRPTRPDQLLAALGFEQASIASDEAVPDAAGRAERGRTTAGMANTVFETGTLTGGAFAHGSRVGAQHPKIATPLPGQSAQAESAANTASFDSDVGTPQLDQLSVLRDPIVQIAQQLGSTGSDEAYEFVAPGPSLAAAQAASEYFKGAQARAAGTAATHEPATGQDGQPYRASVGAPPAFTVTLGEGHRHMKTLLESMSQKMERLAIEHAQREVRRAFDRYQASMRASMRYPGGGS